VILAPTGAFPAGFTKLFFGWAESVYDHDVELIDVWIVAAAGAAVTTPAPVASKATATPALAVLVILELKRLTPCFLP